MRNIVTSFFLFALLVGAQAFAQTADVQVIHNSPDPLANEVDIYINDGLAIDDFAFRAATPVLQLDAEVELVIGVAPGSSMGPEDIIAEFPVTLMAGGSYLVMATGVLDPSLPGNPEGLDTAFTLNIFSPLTTTAPAGEVGLLAYHGAPDAPTVDINAVGVGTLFAGLSYVEFDGYLNVPAGDYVIEIAAGGSTVASCLAPLNGLGGNSAVVFASGFLSGRVVGFGLFAALADGTVLELPLEQTASAETSWSQVKGLY